MNDFQFSYRDQGASQEAPSLAFNYRDEEGQTDLTFNYQDEQSSTPSLEALRQEYGRGFTQEDILQDDRLFSIVERDLQARYPEEGGFVQGTVNAITGLAGGSTLAGWKGMSRKDKFELWQNHQRSFAGGQTVTTVNEVGLVSTADDDAKRIFGEGYELFDNMQGIFTGDDVTWGDTFDGLRDYASAAIWDPTTVLGFGVGKAFSSGGTKVAAQTVKVAAKEAASSAVKSAISSGASKTAAKAAGRAASNKVTQEALKQVGKQAAKAASLKMGLRDFAAYGAVDLVSAIGTDIAYQNVLIDTGARDTYKASQTALSALGVIALPALVTGAKGAHAGIRAATKDTKVGRIFQNYNQVASQVVGVSAEKVNSAVRKKVNLPEVARTLEDTFKLFKANKKNFDPWLQGEQGRVRGAVQKANLKMNDDEVNELFWRTFLFGEPSSTSMFSDLKGAITPPSTPTAKGFIQALEENGFVYVARDFDDNVTNFIGDAISWLPKAEVKRITDEFTAATGKKLPFAGSPHKLSAAFKARMSFAGSVLNEASLSARILNGKGGLTEDVVKEAIKAQRKDAGHYLQSVWKRLLTSHPGTTALNIKGWAATYGMNSASTFVNGVLNYGLGVGAKVVGKDDLAKQFFRTGQSSMLGLMGRGYRLLNPNATAADFDQLMFLIPKAEKELTRELAGDSGVAGMETAAKFGFGESKIASGVERAVGGAQAITGVKLQDEITKQISFMAAFDEHIFKAYGKTFNELTSSKDGLLVTQTQEFMEKVVQPALDKALRETYSKTWSSQKGQSIMLTMGKTVERASSDPMLGYLIPFGRFFNTSMATMGDYSMVNAARHVLKKAMGKEVDVASENFGELFSKGMVGLSFIYFASLKGEEKLESGLSWNQEFESDGSIKDITYDFPESFFHAVGQLGAHLRRDGEVPEKLVSEVLTTMAGQTFRAGEDMAKEVVELAKAIASMQGDEAFNQSLKFVLSGIGKIASGVTRPLDPINTAAMVATEDYETADRRQGVRWWNEATRYVDKLIPETILYGGEREKRNYPTRSGVEINTGRVMGVRETAKPTPIETMLNSIGARAWQEVRWDGSPEVKNRMDELVAPIINTAAQDALAKYPNFFDMPLHQRQTIVSSIVTKSREQVKKILEQGLGDDKSLKLLNEIAQQPKTNVRRVMKKFGIEGELEDLLDTEGGEAKLEMILYFAKEFDENFFPDQKD